MGESKFSLQDLVDWAQLHIERPNIRPKNADDENCVYVAKMYYAIEPKREFRIFLTTDRLLSFTQYVSIRYII